MDTKVIIATVLLAAIVFVGGFVFYYFFMANRDSSMKNLMGSSRGQDNLGAPSEVRKRLEKDETGEEYEKLKKATRSNVSKRASIPLEEKLFYAGIFTAKGKNDFNRLRLLAPIFSVIILGGVTFYFLGAEYFVLGLLLGAGLGYQLPFSYLDRLQKARDEDIMFYLPLVIEQISIGVSSSLDIGPCLQRVVQMADERDTHNVVTELLKYIQNLIKTGASLEDALNEVGRKSGQTELKHAFMSLSQVAKHGGEISRQLQELADAVASQRETRIDSKIKKLELAATGPVALVFAGFLIILLCGFMIQMKGAF